MLYSICDNQMWKGNIMGFGGWPWRHVCRLIIMAPVVETMMDMKIIPWKTANKNDKLQTRKCKAHQNSFIARLLFIQGMTWNHRSISEWTSLCLKVCNRTPLYLRAKLWISLQLSETSWFMVIHHFTSVFVTLQGSEGKEWRTHIGFSCGIKSPWKTYEEADSRHNEIPRAPLIFPNDSTQWMPINHTLRLCIARHQTNKSSKITVQILFIKRPIWCSTKNPSMTSRQDTLRADQLLRNSGNHQPFRRAHLKPTSIIHTQVTFE